MFKVLNSNKAFTLVEILVAATIFSIAITIAIGLFVSAVQLQKYVLNYQQLLNQSSYFMEYMSRSLRMAEKAGDSSCIISGKNYELTHSGEGIKFINSNNNECWEFFTESRQLKINKNGTVYDLTSTDLIVNSFNISVSGDSSGSQPRITTLLDIRGKTTNFYIPKIKIQTTISQRNLNL